MLLGKVNIFFFGSYPYSTSWDPELLIKTNVTEGVAENLVRKKHFLGFFPHKTRKTAVVQLWLTSHTFLPTELVFTGTV
jgi:hypothetical protein